MGRLIKPREVKPNSPKKNIALKRMIPNRLERWRGMCDKNFENQESRKKGLAGLAVFQN